MSASYVSATLSAAAPPAIVSVHSASNMARTMPNRRSRPQDSNTHIPAAIEGGASVSSAPSLAVDGAAVIMYGGNINMQRQTPAASVASMTASERYVRKFE